MVVEYYVADVQEEIGVMECGADQTWEGGMQMGNCDIRQLG